MEWRIFIALAVFIIGNGYWALRYYQASRQTNCSQQQRMAEMESLQDHWLQFSTVAIILIMLLAPLVRQAMLSAE